MGQCLSNGGAASEAAPAPAPKDTALVLLPTGELREYPRPATAERVLDDSSDDGWFLCDSDRMGFEGAVTAVGGAEALRAGRIYFVLPAETGRRGLRREEVAALAVKAAAALAKAAASSASSSGGRRRRCGSVAPLVFAPPEEEDEETAFPARKAAAPTASGKRQSAAGRPRRRFAPDLTAIPESEMSE